MREIKFFMNELVGVPVDASVDGDKEGNDIENRTVKGIHTLFLFFVNAEAAGCAAALTIDLSRTEDAGALERVRNAS